MKHLIRTFLSTIIFFTVAAAFGSVPSLKVTISDSAGKVAFKGTTNSSGAFATKSLPAGNYVVQFNATDSSLKGQALNFIVSAGKKKVTAEAIAGEKLLAGGVAMKVEVGGNLNITGQASSALNAKVDPKTGTIQVAVSFPNSELTLRPGQYGIARAEIEKIPNALLIPQQAVSQLQGSNMVAVVNPDGKAEIRAIKVGETYQGMIVVTEGLKAGEKVIVEGFQRVRQGTPVSAKPFTEASKTEGAKNESEKKPSAGQS